MILISITILVSIPCHFIIEIQINVTMDFAGKILRQSRRQATRRPFFLRTVVRTRSDATASNNTNEKGRNNSMEGVKDRLARAALKQVPRYGWTQDAIAAAVSEDQKLTISMSGMLSPPELVGWFMDDINRQLRTQKSESEGNKNRIGDESVHNNDQFKAIKWRFEQVLPFVESGQWHRGMAMGLSTPFITRDQLKEFIDIIAPDNCSDTYHMALGTIFVATELHLLADSSPNYVDTWSFLESRLNELESQQQQYGDIDYAHFLMHLASVPSPSMSSVANMTNSIPVVAGMAVAQSLVEGAASLVFPQSSSVSPPNKEEQSHNTNGTRASDYESPKSSTHDRK